MLVSAPKEAKYNHAKEKRKLLLTKEHGSWVILLVPMITGILISGKFNPLVLFLVPSIIFFVFKLYTCRNNFAWIFKKAKCKYFTFKCKVLVWHFFHSIGPFRTCCHYNSWEIFSAFVCSISNFSFLSKYVDCCPKTEECL